MKTSEKVTSLEMKPRRKTTYFLYLFPPSYSSFTLGINQVLSDFDQVLRVLIEDEGNYKGVEEFKIKHDED
jgi:hypothetical protein